MGGAGRHLSMQLEQHGVRLRAVAIGGGDWIDELSQSSSTLSIAFVPVINRFRGARNVEVQIRDWRFDD